MKIPAPIDRALWAVTLTTFGVLAVGPFVEDPHPATTPICFLTLGVVFLTARKRASNKRAAELEAKEAAEAQAFREAISP